MRKSELMRENEELRSEIAELKARVRATTNDYEIGMKNPKELALHWLCYDFNASVSLTGHVLDDYIQKLIAIQKLDGANDQCQCGKHKGDICPENRAE